LILVFLVKLYFALPDRNEKKWSIKDMDNNFSRSGNYETIKLDKPFGGVQVIACGDFK
jgi:hypothetical protein